MQRPDLRRRPTLIWVLAIGALAACAMLVAVALSGSRGHRTSKLAESRERLERDARTQPSAADRSPSSFGGLSSVDERTRRGRPEGVVLLRAIRQTALSAVRQFESLGTEGMANQMDPYLLGMLKATTAIDPNLIPDLGKALADDICHKPPGNDLELMLASKLVMLESGIGSSRLFGCAFQQHPTEDVVLWSLLDAWNNAGREPVPALASIERNATDQRTQRRFLPPAERHPGRIASLPPQAKDGK